MSGQKIQKRSPMTPTLKGKGNKTPLRLLVTNQKMLRTRRSRMVRTMRGLTKRILGVMIAKSLLIKIMLQIMTVMTPMTRLALPVRIKGIFWPNNIVTSSNLESKRAYQTPMPSTQNTTPLNQR